MLLDLKERVSQVFFLNDFRNDALQLYQEFKESYNFAKAVV